MIEWEAWYAGGGRFTSVDWTPAELASTGIIGVVEYLVEVLTPAGVPYRIVHNGDDWYVWDAGRWSGPSGGDTGDWVPEPQGEVVIRSALSLTDQEWATAATAMFDAKVPPSWR